MPATISDDRVFLSDGSYDPKAGLLHAASPFMIGLVGSVIGMAFLAPGMLRNSSVIVSALLIPSMIVCVGIYAWSVISPGDIVGVIIDRSTRTLELVQANAFASRQMPLHFDEIARIAVEQSYDQDGYATQRGVLILRTGDQVALGFPFDEAAAADLRRQLGMVESRRG